MANVNTKTGIPYGAINGNSVPYLLDEIFSSGESLTFAAWKNDLIETIRGALEQIADDNGAFGDRISRIAAACNPDEIAEAMLDAGLNDRIEFDEEEHEYSESTPFGEVHYLQSYLGGAPLIWVTDSPFVAYARGCSPCVPGAGDLDNLMDAESDNLCYCCPPDCFRDGDDKETHAVVGSIDLNGRTYQIVGLIPQELTFDVFRSENRAGGSMQHAGQVSARDTEHALEIAQGTIECDAMHSLSVKPVE